jgi:hypothetical protein
VRWTGHDGGGWILACEAGPLHPTGWELSTINISRIYGYQAERDRHHDRLVPIAIEKFKDKELGQVPLG